MSGKRAVAGLSWRKSSRSDSQGACVEVANLHQGYRAVRDSKNPVGPVLACTEAEWAAFVAAVRDDEFG